MAEHIVSVDITGGRFLVSLVSGRTQRTLSPEGGKPLDRDAAWEFLAGNLQGVWEDGDTARITIGTKRTKRASLRAALNVIDTGLVLPTIRRNTINPSRQRQRKKP